MTTYTPKQLEALERFRVTCNDAVAKCNAADQTAYAEYHTANQVALAQRGWISGAAFKAYSDTHAQALETYWREIQEAADVCARGMTAAT
jgi:hypothetical protein